MIKLQNKILMVTFQTSLTTLAFLALSRQQRFLFQYHSSEPWIVVAFLTLECLLFSSFHHLVKKAGK